MEINIYVKNISRVKRVAYIYPSTYRVMISGLSADIIYNILNRHEDIYVERFVCRRLFGIEEQPRSIETKSKLKDFNLILTSIHYEPDIVNLTRLLLAGGIEPLSIKREKQVVLAGGPVCMENPIPYSDILDACVVGEAEVTLEKIVDLWLQYGDSKKRFLEEIKSLSYVSADDLSSGKVVKEYVRDLNSSFYPIRQVENTSVEPIYGKGFKLEVSRGCPFWCSFCMEAKVFQPFRERELGTLKMILEEGMKYTLSGRRVILFSLAFPLTKTHYDLLQYLRDNKYYTSLPSLRVTPYLEKSLDLIKDLGQKTITLAPESFSPLVQSAIFKYAGMVDYIVSTVENIIERGFNVKLYLIYGFKGLKEIEANVEIVNRLIRLAKTYGKKISVSLNPLIPKPHTIFQWVGMYSREELSNILKALRGGLASPVEARVFDIDWAIVQAQLALSSKPVGPFIIAWAKYGGGLSGWRRAVKEMNVNYKYVFSGYGEQEKLPWENIELGRNVNEVLRVQYTVYKKLSSSTNPLI